MSLFELVIVLFTLVIIPFFTFYQIEDKYGEGFEYLFIVPVVELIYLLFTYGLYITVLTLFLSLAIMGVIVVIIFSITEDEQTEREKAKAIREQKEREKAEAIRKQKEREKAEAIREQKEREKAEAIRKQKEREKAEAIKKQKERKREEEFIQIKKGIALLQQKNKQLAEDVETLKYAVSGVSIYDDDFLDQQSKILEYINDAIAQGNV